MNWLLFFLVFPFSLTANPARTVMVQKDEVVTVKTALGIATIIQVPDQPTSVVLGDSAAFKVEYLNQAVTIKPLHHSATSNLYIHTDFERYSVKLVTGAPPAADFVVYLKPNQAFQPVSPDLRWKTIGALRTSDFGQIAFRRMAKTPSTIILEFEITPIRDGRLDPAAFWLLQGKLGKPIQELLLSTLEAKKARPLMATVVIKKSDLKAHSPASVEVRFKNTVSFLLSREMLWKD